MLLSQVLRQLPQSRFLTARNTALVSRMALSFCKTPFSRHSKYPRLLFTPSPSSLLKVRHLTSSRRALNQAPKENNQLLLQPPKQKTQTYRRLTKSALLAQASNRFSRLLIHVKWPLIRNNRPFSIDDMSAFVSWALMGNALWIVLGTTTFGLVLMYSIHTFDHIWDTIRGREASDEERENTKVPQKDDSILGFIAGSILSQGLGLRFEFKKGSVLPEMKGGMLTFRNFNVYARDAHKQENSKESRPLEFEAHIESMNVSLSFSKWYEGNGLIHELEVYGMHGKAYKVNDVLVDSEMVKKNPFNAFALSFSRYNETAHLQHDINDHYHEELKSLKAHPSVLDAKYELSNVKFHDSYLEIYDIPKPTPGEEHDVDPFKITIFNCDLPRLRGNRILIDFFNASNVTGAINDSMFTIHKRQQYDASDNDNMVRFKLDGINMGSIASSNPQLKFNWIVNGRAEITADIRLPLLDEYPDSDSGFRAEYGPLSRIVQLVYDELKSVTSQGRADEESTSFDDDKSLMKGALAAIYETFQHKTESPKVISGQMDNSEYVLVNVTVKFHDLKASLPRLLPMASSTLIPFISLPNLRYLIGFINSSDSENRPPIVVKTTVIEKISDLYNADNLSQTKIFDVIIGDIYDELLKMVKLDEKRIIEQSSTLWSHSLASQLVLLGLGVLA